METLPTEQSFNPTKHMRVAKARFWKAVEDNPLIDPTCLSVAEISRLAGSPTLPRWVRDNEGFKQWFTSKDEIKVMLKMGAEAAVDRLVKIVQEDRVGPKEAVSAGTQVQAAKLLLEFAGMAPAKQSEVRITKEQLPDDENELRQYIEAGVSKLKIAGGT